MSDSTRWLWQWATSSGRAFWPPLEAVPVDERTPLVGSMPSRTQARSTNDMPASLGLHRPSAAAASTGRRCVRGRAIRVRRRGPAQPAAARSDPDDAAVHLVEGVGRLVVVVVAAGDEQGRGWTSVRRNRASTGTRAMASGPAVTSEVTDPGPRRCGQGSGPRKGERRGGHRLAGTRGGTTDCRHRSTDRTAFTSMSAFFSSSERLRAPNGRVGNAGCPGRPAPAPGASPRTSGHRAVDPEHEVHRRRSCCEVNGTGLRMPTAFRVGRTPSWRVEAQEATRPLSVGSRDEGLGDGEEVLPAIDSGGPPGPPPRSRTGWR